MKYLVKNVETNVIELLFEMPIQPTYPLVVIEVPDDEYKERMLSSIFIDVNNYTPNPREWGEDWWESNGTDWIDTRDDERIWVVARTIRDEELSESDWTQLNDSPLTPPEQAEWTAYRAKLRSIPNSFPKDPHKAETAIKDTIRDNKPVTARKVKE